MTYHAFLKLVVFHSAENADFETEVQSQEALAATEGLREWALSELDGDDFWREALQGKPLGFYCIMFAMTLKSGKDADTPYGPGDYWSEGEVSGRYHVTRLADEDVSEETVALYKELGDKLWAPTPNHSFQLLRQKA